MQFHLTPEQVGLVFLSCPLLFVLLSLVAGPLADKFVSLHVTREREVNLTECNIAFSRGQDGLRSLDSLFVVLDMLSSAQLTLLQSRKLNSCIYSLLCYFKHRSLIVCSKLWITIVAFSFVGAGASFAAVPVYSDMLTVAKCVDYEIN